MRALPILLMPLAGCVFIPQPPPCDNGCVVLAEESFLQPEVEATDVVWLIDPNSPDAITAAAGSMPLYLNSFLHLDADTRLALAVATPDGVQWLPFGGSDWSVPTSMVTSADIVDALLTISFTDPVDLAAALQGLSATSQWSDFRRDDAQLHVQMVSDAANGTAPASALDGFEGRLHVAGPSWCAELQPDSWVQQARSSGGTVVPSCSRIPDRFWMHAAAGATGLETVFPLESPPVPGTFVVQAWRGSAEIAVFEHGMSEDVQPSLREEDCINPVGCLQYGYDIDTNSIFSLTSTVPSGSQVVVRFYVDEGISD